MRTAQPHIITFLISLLIIFECVKPDDTITVPTIDGRKKSLDSILENNKQSNGLYQHQLGCASPEVLVNGAPSPDIVGTVSGGNFASIQEIQFVGLVGAYEQKRICKIKCLNGVWVGPLCAMEHGSDQFEPMLHDCHLHRIESPVVISDSNGTELMIRPDGVTLPHGTHVQMRCEEVGLHKFVGNTSMQCVDGLWSTVMPHCQATTLHTNFSLDVPPSIIYSVVDGNYGVDPQGRLVLVPGSIVHFDCIFPRQNGNPKWTWTNSNSQSHYNTGWTKTEKSDDNSESESWKYRLSIHYSKPDIDSGKFTCTTPNGYDNSIQVIVKSVECPAIEAVDSNLVMSVEGNHLDDKAYFSCIEGYYPLGIQTIQCLVTGQWSSTTPKCILIECPELDDDDIYLRITSTNRSYGSKVKFSCPTGYQLIGPNEITCLKNKSWNDLVPKCQAITCPSPTPPTHGRLIDSGRYLSGDYIQFTCITGYVLVGESLSVCLENGTWSSPEPKCKRVCEFPGVLPHGYIEPTKFNYDVDEIVAVICQPNYKLIGPQSMKCNSNGQWTGGKPKCEPIDWEFY